VYKMFNSGKTKEEILNYIKKEKLWHFLTHYFLPGFWFW
jgi:hypothetical protein